jgi:hypothetical protein
MKKITLFIALMTTSLGFAQSFPFTFESGTTTFTDFDGGVTTQITNPVPGGINTSAKVAQMVKSTGQPWGGSYITMPAPIDFSVNKVVKLKVYFPVAGKKLLLKFEGSGNDANNFQIESATVPANVWTELSFDYSGISNNLNPKMVFIFDLGTMGDGTANSTYYFDDVTFSPPVVVYDQIVLPLDFENTNQNFLFTNFDGGELTKIANPQMGPANPSATVLQMKKNFGQPWGGGWFQLASNIDLSLGKYFRMLVYSPKVGGRVLFKLEGTGPATQIDSPPLVMGWQEVVWDFTALPAGTYNKIIFINDLDVMGDGTAAFTYYYDNIRQATTLSTAKFETSSVKMYPNPVRNTLTIDANSSIQKVSVYNILGQEVMKASPKSNSVTLQTSELQKGAYMVRTEIDGKVSTSKIIKE